MSSAQQISLEIRKVKDKIFSPSFLKNLTTKLAAKSLQLMWDRIDAGYDVNGDKFGSYTFDYKVRKRKLLSGKMKGRGGGTSRTLADYRSAKIGKFAAKTVNDKMRLTGRLRDDTLFKVTQFAQFNGNKLNLSWRLFIAQRSAKKAEGLMSRRGRNKYSTYAKKAWLFLGLSKRGSRKTLEQKELNKIVQKAIQDRIKSKSKLKDF